MQISDLVKQYHQAISSGAETLTGTKGVEIFLRGRSLPLKMAA